MSSENKVDPNTDDLDAFSLLMAGQAKEKTDTDDTTPEDDDLETDEEDLEEEAEEEVEEEDEESEPEPEPKPTKKSSVQKRIDDLVSARHEVERQRLADKVEFERKIAELTAKVEGTKDPAPTSPIAAEAPKPDAKNADGELLYPLGEFDPTFIRDLTRFTIKQETEAAKEAMKNESRQAEQEAARTALTSEWSEKLAKAPETYPDIQESNLALQSTFTDIDPAYGEYLAATIMSMDHGVDVLAYLGKHLDEAKQIVASGPAKATIALGRLEARFLTGDNAPAPTKKVSKAAPPPPNRSRGTGGSGSKIAADTDDLDAFEKLYFKK